MQERVPSMYMLYNISGRWKAPGIRLVRENEKALLKKKKRNSLEHYVLYE